MVLIMWVLDNIRLQPGEEFLAHHLNASFSGYRFVIPLALNDELYGICIIGQSEALSAPLSWEDFDLMKVISRECTGFLALHQAMQTLVEHEQFAAVNMTLTGTSM